MKASASRRSIVGHALLGLVCLGAMGLTGCQLDVGGQTIPSPYYLTDDVQYFPRGPEFKLSREAAAMKAYNEEVATKQQR